MMHSPQRSFTFPRRLRFPLHALWQLTPAGFPIPLLERFVGDLALDEKFGEFAPLRLALEGHDAILMRRVSSGDHQQHPGQDEELDSYGEKREQFDAEHASD